MKLLYTVLVVLIVTVSAWGQNAPANFRFNWESGEYSMDAHFEDSTWQLDGNTLSYTHSDSGRNSGPEFSGDQRKFPIKMVLSKQQLEKLALLLKPLVTAPSLNLLPKNFQGTFSSYTLISGTSSKEVSFSAPRYQTNKWDNQDSAGTTQKIKSEIIPALYTNFNALRDYLLMLNF